MKDLRQEQFRALRLRIVEKLLRCPLLDDLAVVHENDAISHGAGKAHLVFWAVSRGGRKTRSRWPQLRQASVTAGIDTAGSPRQPWLSAALSPSWCAWQERALPAWCDRSKCGANANHHDVSSAPA